MSLTTNTCIIFLLAAISISVVVDGAHHHGNHTATAPAPAPASVDCTSVVMNMVDCLSYVQNGSTVTKPEAKCCSGLKSVLDTNAECLCEAYKNSASLGIVLDLKKAMTLPAVCKISTPAPTCGSLMSTAPAGAPGTAPSAAGPTGIDSGSTLKSPIPAPASSAPSMLRISAGSVVIGLVAVLLSVLQVVLPF